MITILVFTWLVLIPVWPLAVFIFEDWSETSFSAKRKFVFASGEVFAGSGGVGALLGITSSTNDAEVTMRILIGCTVIILGFVLMYLNLED